MPENNPYEPTPDGDGKGSEVQPQEDFQMQSAGGPRRRTAQSPDPFVQTAGGRPDTQGFFQPQQAGAVVRQGAPPDGTGPHVTDSEPRADQATRDQIVINGMLAIFASIREEVRSYRGLLFSNLVLAFTIPLSALAAQHPEILQRPLWIFSRPQWWLFSFWVSGVVLMMAGILRIMPSLMTGSERLSLFRAKQAAEALKDGKMTGAVNSLGEAIRKEDERLKATSSIRVLFVLAFILYLACVGFEFALVLFTH